MNTPDDFVRDWPEDEFTVCNESKQVANNGTPHYSVTIEIHGGVQYQVEAFGEEAHDLEKAVEKLKRCRESSGATPKIFIGGNNSPGGPPVSAGSTNQAKSTGLPNDLDKSKPTKPGG